MRFAETPAGALPAPDFTAELVDGTEVTASDLWRDRPVVLVFTASWCERCRGVHRDVAAAVVADAPGAALLGVVGEDDLEGAAEYADELDLGRPGRCGAASRTWLDYAAREPPWSSSSAGREGAARLARRRDRPAAGRTRRPLAR